MESYKCRWCPATFNRLQDLYYHEDIEITLEFLNGKVGEHKCRICGDSFSEIGSIKTHHEMHNNSIDVDTNVTAEGEHHTDRQFKCNKCGKYFKYKCTLARHERTCSGHNNGVRSAQFKCDVCGKEYKRMQFLSDHKKAHHSDDRFGCSKCAKQFRYKRGLVKHESICQNKSLECQQCGRLCTTAFNLQQHEASHVTKTNRKRKRDEVSSSQPSTSSSPKREMFRCRRCPQTFDNRSELYVHGMRNHFQTGAGLQPTPWNNSPAPWVYEGGGINEGLRREYNTNAPLILEQHRPGPVMSVYNVPVDNTVTPMDMIRVIGDIFDREQHAFRLNIVFGVILENRETGAYRYFKPFGNNTVFDEPVYISKRYDLSRIYQRLKKLDLIAELLRSRPDTKWVPVLLTNIRFTVYHTHYPVGHGGLPAYIKNKCSIVALDVNRTTGKPYADHLCAFRCLAVHKGNDRKCLERPTQEYYKRWRDRENTTGHAKQFDGVSLDEFPEFESTFKINLEVYSLDESGFARCVYRSRGRFKDTMYVNLHENHLSYVKNFSQYAQKFRCRTCDRHFNRSHNLFVHQRNCGNKTRYTYPGGFHTPPKSVFDRLEEYDIDVPDADRTFPWFIVFDFEAMLEKVNERNTPWLQWTQKHVPISVSICSNVPGHTNPRCIVDPNLDGLVVGMVEIMEEIAQTVAELAEEKWGWARLNLKKQVKDSTRSPEIVPVANYDWDEEEEDEDEERGEDPKALEGAEKDLALQQLYGQCQGYMTQVPVLGFNSAKYDLNLVKQKLARHLCMDDSKGAFVVKRNNEYACLSSPILKFLDIMHFLAPGTSYARFLKAYGVEERKGYFPYEWFDDVSKLEHPSLPPQEAFYSTLKNENISDESYAYCQRVWRENRMQTFEEFLVWYNNLDVQPFVKAVRRLQTFYFEKGIDVLKTAISVPGIARQMLFKTAKEAGVNFALFDKNNEDLYRTFKHNIVGGPSVIFTRAHEVGKTYIRGNKHKPCGKIVGFDANALYLWAIDQEMPVGPFIRRRASDKFRPEVRDRYMSAYYWMNWLNHNGEAKISHMLNAGKEKRIGKYPVDGWDSNTNTVYQFHGCYFHGHVCASTQNVNDPDWMKVQPGKLQKTKDIADFIRTSGHTLVEMWECEFKQYCKEHPRIYEFINSSRPGYFQKHRDEVTEIDVLTGVRSGQLFGAVEVDIKVPEKWHTKVNTPLSPYDYFAEMSPLFCNTEIPFDAFGDHMQQHVKAAGLSEAPRRLLVGGMSGRNMLIATPLLKWYLDHGMQVMKVHQVVEFQANACFKRFVRDVSDARRAGDVKPEMSIIADTMKLIGNSGFGSLIMDKTKHREIKYVQGENDACMIVNDPRFRQLDCLDAEYQYYEVEMAKKRISLDLPIQLGYFILQYAKLRMLEFYYDFMDKYVNRCDFEYLEMDTDSAYMAISASALDDVIKPTMRENYDRGLKGFCLNANVEADSGFHWFPRTCCEEHVKFDKRTPGLFKTEFEGDEMIGLCSKTYIVRKSNKVKPSSASIASYRLLRRAKRLGTRVKARSSTIKQEYKFSCKGINKRTVRCPMSTFRRVLRMGVPRSCTNRGFRAKDNTIYTYAQERRGFSYFYCKRQVLADGIHTKPLDVVLCPNREEDLEEVDDRKLVAILNELQDENEGKTTVVNVSAASLRKSGYRDLRNWLEDPAHVYIGRECQYVPGARRSKWCNPFSLAKYSREEALRLYENYVRNSPLMNDLESLRGKVLGCWCHPEPCHGGVLISLLND